MDLRTRVIFNLTTETVSENYTPRGRFIDTHEYNTYVKNLDKFREFITNFANAAKFGKMDVNKGTYKINIKQNVIVYDADDRKNFAQATFPGDEMTVILSTTDKLLYVSDIENLLRTKSPEFSFKQPIIINPKPIYLEYFDGVNVKYDALANNRFHNDIVIDTNLNQIWPLKTNQPPVDLIKLLSNTNVKVR